MPAEMFGGEGIVAEIEILRGDLAGILHEATASTVEYLFDDSIAGLVQDGDGVTVTFERAAPRRFDLVVGTGRFASTTGRAGGWCCSAMPGTAPPR